LESPSWHPQFSVGGGAPVVCSLNLSPGRPSADFVWRLPTKYLAPRGVLALTREAFEAALAAGATLLPGTGGRSIDATEPLLDADQCCAVARRFSSVARRECQVWDCSTLQNATFPAIPYLRGCSPPSDSRSAGSVHE